MKKAGGHYSENVITVFYKIKNKPRKNHFCTTHPEIIKSALVLYFQITTGFKGKDCEMCFGFCSWKKMHSTVENQSKIFFY